MGRGTPVEPPTPASPPTLLLPTSEAREPTSDGTILSPHANPSRERRGSGRRWSDLRSAQERLAGALARLSRWVRDGRSFGLGLLTSAIALAFAGVVAVAYVYVTADDPRAGPRASTAAAEHGLIDRVVDLGRRLQAAKAPGEGFHDSP